jgi:hypothetical protein
MVFIAIANGAARDLGYGREMGKLAAHQISTLTALVLFSLYIWLILRRLPPRSSAQAMGIGALWLMLTLSFEFLFGHYVAGLPWARLVSDYNILTGRLWVLIPIWLAIAPLVYLRLRKQPTAFREKPRRHRRRRFGRS